jgi:hypothetical protein
MIGLGLVLVFEQAPSLFASLQTLLSIAGN